MTVAPIGNGMYLVLTADTKPTTGVITGAICINTQTGVISYYTGSTWTDAAGGGGGGEANTAANVGTGAGTIFRDKTSVTLNLKTIKAGTGVTITNNTNDITLDATGAGGGEVNTASNFGASGTGVWKDKNGVDLRFYKLASVDSKLTIALSGTDHIDFTVNQANLSIAWSQITSGVPSTFAPSSHKSEHVSGGGDAFVKADVLAAAFRYIETRTDPPSDAQAIWINATSSDMKYWDTQASPVKQTVATLATAQTLANKTLTAPVIATISNTGTLTLPTATDTLVGRTTTDTLTNKALDAATNTITNIADANMGSHTSTKITITAKGQLNSSIAYTDAAVTMGDFNLTLKDNRLTINNPADSFAYTVIAAAIAGNRSITLPLLTANDTMVTEAFTQSLTNKTINATNNTITDSSQAAGDILKNNGSKFVRMGRGTALQVLRTNSGATDLEFASLNSENAGTALASGNGSTTTFNIAHGLGSTPYQAMVQCSSHTNAFTYTYDATNIIVVFGTAPSSGTNNVKFQFRATL